MHYSSWIRLAACGRVVNGDSVFPPNGVPGNRQPGRLTRNRKRKTNIVPKISLVEVRCFGPRKESNDYVTKKKAFCRGNVEA